MESPRLGTMWQYSEFLEVESMVIDSEFLWD
jgi:hypothetical protein